MPAFDYGYVVQLNFLEAKTTHASVQTSQYPAGTLGLTGDRRWYAYGRAGASTLVVGNVLQGPAVVANHVNNTAVATAVNATSVTFTQGATAITAGQYQDGWLNISVTPGAGQMYGLSSPQNAVGSAASNAYQLTPGEFIQTALTTTSRIDLISSPFRGLIQMPATTATGVPVGVAVSAPTTGQWCWVQVAGMASVLTAGTVVIGEEVIVPTGTAGACGPSAASETDVPIGRVMRVAASTAWSAINLQLLP